MGWIVEPRLYAEGSAARQNNRGGALPGDVVPDPWRALDGVPERNTVLADRGSALTRYRVEPPSRERYH